MVIVQHIIFSYIADLYQNEKKSFQIISNKQVKLYNFVPIFF